MIAKRMKLGFSGKVRGGGGLRSIVASKTDDLFVNANLGAELQDVFAKTNTTKPGSIPSVQSMLVLVVFGTGCLSEVVKSVIRAVAVYVVDVTTRKPPINIQKSETVRPIGFAINSDCDVSLAMKMSSYSANLDAKGRGFEPMEQPSIRAIVQNFAQSFGGNVCRIFHSHDAPPVRWDQGPGRVDSACLASPY